MDDEERLVSRLVKIINEINDLSKQLSPFLIKIAHLRNEAETIKKQLEEKKIENTAGKV